MKRMQHIAVYTNAEVDTHWLIKEIQSGSLFDFSGVLKSKVGELFTNAVLQHFIKEEIRHERYILSPVHNNRVATASNGEQRLALLQYLLHKRPNYLILDNLFDSLDINAQQRIRQWIKEISSDTLIVQILNRKEDSLDFIEKVYIVQKNKLVATKTRATFLQNDSAQTSNDFTGNVPPPEEIYTKIENPLIKLTNVSVQFGERKILNNISWEVNAGEFWQLVGPNGSGKTTILAMITGDNVKGYGQNLVLFGKKKGSGESVWEIKQKIGYFASYMVQQFERPDTAEQMIIGGFFDSVGLYIIPTDRQKALALQWLELLGLSHQKDTAFYKLTPVHQRMILLARAMVKHPPLLILDEPGNGLDDAGAILLTALINKIAAETTSAILYVSHRKEAGLLPDHILELIPGTTGSTGRQTK